VIVAGGLGRAIPDTPRNERKIAGAILACWSLVHGLNLLLAAGLVGPRKKSGALSDSLVQGMLDGLAAELPTLPPGTWVGPQVPHRYQPGRTIGHYNIQAVMSALGYVRLSQPVLPSAHARFASESRPLGPAHRIARQ